MWQEALQVLLQRYEPAQSLCTSSHQFSTLDIKRILMEHTGEDIPQTELTKALRERGFIYVNTSYDELCLEWLMNYVEVSAMPVLSEADTE